MVVDQVYKKFRGQGVAGHSLFDRVLSLRASPSLMLEFRQVNQVILSYIHSHRFDCIPSGELT